MANHSKFIKLLLSFVIAISPIILINNANAATQTIGGWQVVSNIGQGIGAKLTATKEVMVNGASKVASGTANITPNPTNVAKFLAKAGGLALADIALRQLFDGIDYVLDPVNNSITYRKKSDDSIVQPYDKYRYFVSATNQYVASVAALQKITDAYYVSSTWTNCLVGSNDIVTCHVKNDSSGTEADIVSGYKQANPSYNPSVDNPNKPISVPVPAVASQVIDQAEKDIRAGNPTSPAVTLSRAVAQDMVTEAKTDDVKARPIVQQLENTQSFATTETAEGTVTNPSVTDPVTGEVKPVPPSNIALDFPVFCGWAPSVCVAADVVVKAPAQILEQIETLKEWAKTEESTDTEIDIPDQHQQEIDTQVSFSSQCPANIKLADFSYHGISQSWDVDFSKFCDVFATYLRPVVIAMGAFSAVLIVSGVGVRENV